MRNKPAMGRKPILRTAIASRLEHEPMTVPELSQALGRTSSAINSTLSRMEEMRLVRRNPGRPSNPRAYVFELVRRA